MRCHGVETRCPYVKTNVNSKPLDARRPKSPCAETCGRVCGSGPAAPLAGVRTPDGPFSQHEGNIAEEKYMKQIIILLFKYRNNNDSNHFRTEAILKNL